MWAQVTEGPSAGEPVGLVLTDEWRATRPENQRPAADAALAAWDGGVPPGLLAHHCLLDEDTTGILHYMHWSSPDACRTFLRTGRSDWSRWVNAAVPGTRAGRATEYRMYRSTDPTDGGPPAGCLATVTVNFEGPDARRQRDWIDNVFASSGTSRAALEAGLIAAHFHVSVDGTRVLNLAEWTTAEAHRRAAEAPAPRLRRTTQHSPGVVGLAVRRFAPYRGIAAVDG